MLQLVKYEVKFYCYNLFITYIYKIAFMRKCSLQWSLKLPSSKWASSN